MGILKTMTAVLNIAFGLYSLFQPEQIASASGRKYEFRFGGFFIGFGAAALLLNDPEATRLLQLVMENSAIADRSFMALLMIESAVGLILIL